MLLVLTKKKQILFFVCGIGDLGVSLTEMFHIISQ